MEFRLLGPLSVIDRGRVRTPTAPKVRQMLSLLLLRANHTVGLDAAVEELWGDHPPHSAVLTTRTYIYLLRKAFPDWAIETVPLGYVLHVDEAVLDFKRFDRLFAEAQSCHQDGQIERAARRVDQALAVWSGPALSNVPRGRVLDGLLTALEDKRIAALELHIRTQLLLGRHRELIAELRALVAEHPFNEWFHSQLIFALHLAGRRGEALRAYRDVCGLLSDELGLAPSADLQRAHQDVLTATVREPA
ncbi:AfsR/SARP family transcriptional regulator [Amycolatopsis samaneae]|uniref:AfsR/SARP family transcriptional regulator n=1 Tax=Amycolatopsis samaneae TaxID=664691 RepID=A0ABW5GS11_9PSEU